MTQVPTPPPPGTAPAVESPLRQRVLSPAAVNTAAAAPQGPRSSRTRTELWTQISSARVATSPTIGGGHGQDEEAGAGNADAHAATGYNAAHDDAAFEALLGEVDAANDMLAGHGTPSMPTPIGLDDLATGDGGDFLLSGRSSVSGLSGRWSVASSRQSQSQSRQEAARWWRTRGSSKGPRLRTLSVAALSRLQESLATEESGAPLRDAGNTDTRSEASAGHAPPSSRSLYSSDGTAIALTQADIGKIRDAETLRFLADNSAWIARYMAQRPTPSRASATPSGANRTRGAVADDGGFTFMTAVDDVGAAHRITLVRALSPDALASDAPLPDGDASPAYDNMAGSGMGLSTGPSPGAGTAHNADSHTAGPVLAAATPATPGLSNDIRQRALGVIEIPLELITSGGGEDGRDGDDSDVSEDVLMRRLLDEYGMNTGDTASGEAPTAGECAAGPAQEPVGVADDDEDTVMISLMSAADALLETYETSTDNLADRPSTGASMAPTDLDLSMADLASIAESDVVGASTVATPRTVTSPSADHTEDTMRQAADGRDRPPSAVRSSAVITEMRDAIALLSARSQGQTAAAVGVGAAMLNELRRGGLTALAQLLEGLGQREAAGRAARLRDVEALHSGSGEADPAGTAAADDKAAAGRAFTVQHCGRRNPAPPAGPKRPGPAQHDDPYQQMQQALQGQLSRFRAVATARRPEDSSSSQQAPAAIRGVGSSTASFSSTAPPSGPSSVAAQGIAQAAARAQGQLLTAPERARVDALLAFDGPWGCVADGDGTGAAEADVAALCGPPPGLTPEDQARVASIDDRLRALQRAREESATLRMLEDARPGSSSDAGDREAGPTATLGLAHVSPSYLSPNIAALLQRLRADKGSAGGAVRRPSAGSLNASVVSVVTPGGDPKLELTPAHTKSSASSSSKATEAPPVGPSVDAQDDQRRRQLGNQYLREAAEAKLQRAYLKTINMELHRIHEQNNGFFDPAFAMARKYDLGDDPSTFHFPDGLQRPSEDLIAELVATAAAEDMSIREAQGLLDPNGELVVSTPAAQRTTSQHADTSDEVPKGTHTLIIAEQPSAYQESLRDRLKRLEAMAAADEAAYASMQRYSEDDDGGDTTNETGAATGGALEQPA